MKKRIAQEKKKEDKEEVGSYNEIKKHNLKICRLSFVRRYFIR